MGAVKVLLRPHHAAQGQVSLGAWTGDSLLGTGTMSRRTGARPIVRAEDPAVAAALRTALRERVEGTSVHTLAVEVPDAAARSPLQELTRAVLAAPAFLLRR